MKVEALLKGINTLIKGTLETLASSPCEDTSRRCSYEPEGSPTSHTEPTRALIVDFPASRL